MFYFTCHTLHICHTLRAPIAVGQPAGSAAAAGAEPAAAADAPLHDCVPWAPAPLVLACGRATPVVAGGRSRGASSHRGASTCRPDHCILLLLVLE
eukprot:965427-Pelagomonas_calceolata.AAC.1